jgi:hypothetical protein
MTPSDPICKCGHLESWHKPNRELFLSDPDKYCMSTHGVCAKRTCSCCQFKAREVMA